MLNKAVLNHAEEKQIKDEGVKSWLEDLQDLAYDADDILDDFAYEELRLKLHKTQAEASTSKVQKLLPSCCTGTDFTPSSFLFKNAMIPKMKEITARLNSLSTQRSSLELSEILPQAASSERKKPARLQLTSVMDGGVEYVGRENEKREMLDLLKTNNSDGVCVLSIVGMGGMGKTTLAQLVYNNDSLEKSFDHKAWVCVSEDFNAVKLSNSILQSIHPSSSDLNDLNLLQVKLKEKLSEKRFMLVIDDLWNESYDDWTILRSPFGSLQTFSFWGLPNWEEWDACEGDEQVSRFPSLGELSIRECPQLLERLPTRLHSLQRLEIYECRRLVVSISSYPSLHELSVEGCEELVDECSSSPVEEVASLQSAFVSSISKFSIVAERRLLRLLRFANSKIFKVYSKKLPEALYAFTFLTRMELVRCEGLVCFAESNFPPALKELMIYECDELQYLFDESMSSKTCLLEHLEIKWCSSLIWLSSRGDICNRLQHLLICFCKKLRSLFLNSKLPVMLKQLHICGCPALEGIVQDFHETTHLERILICGAENIKALPRGLDKLSHMQEINLQRCSNMVVCFEEIGLPTTNLRAFEICNCEKIVALPRCINSFTSLQRLIVYNCRADICFPDEGFPTSLVSLEIRKAPNMYSSLVEWGFHKLTSLQHLQIIDEECSNVVSFPEETRGMTLPPSLISIWISGFKNLEFMCSKGFQHLNSLQYLTISSCPKLTCLPEKDMLLSLGYLSIYSCPLLEEECRRVKGREWSKISHIPKVLLSRKAMNIFNQFALYRE